MRERERERERIMSGLDFDVGGGADGFGGLDGYSFVGCFGF